MYEIIGNLELELYKIIIDKIKLFTEFFSKV